MCMALTGTLDAKTAALSEDRLLILGKPFEVWWVVVSIEAVEGLG